MYSTLSDSYDPRRPAAAIDGAFVSNVSAVDVNGVAEPVSLDDLCDYARVDLETGFGLEAIAKGVRKSAEQRFELSIVNQTVTVFYRGPSIDCRLPRMPFKALTGVFVVDNGEDGEDIKDGFYVQGDRLYRSDGFAIGGNEVLKVVYSAGYDEGETPDDIILAIKQLSNDSFCMRGSKVIGKNAYTIPDSGMDLFQNYVR